MGRGAQPQATASTTPRVSAREGGTRATNRGREHHARRHTPHRHTPTSTQTPHRHRTHHTHPSPAAAPKTGGTPTPTDPPPRHVGSGTMAARPKGRAAGGGTAPDTRRPSEWWKATPLGRPPTTLAAAAPRRACKPKGQCWAPTPAHPRPQHVGSGPRQPALRTGSRGRESASTQKRLTTPHGTLPGDALPPPRQRATVACKSARCGAAAGSPRPHEPRLENTGRGTLAALPKGRAAGGGTAPDTRRSSQPSKATPPRNGPPSAPRHAAPRGACKEKGQCWAPRPAHQRPQHVSSGPRQPALRTGAQGRESA